MDNENKKTTEKNSAQSGVISPKKGKSKKAAVSGEMSWSSVSDDFKAVNKARKAAEAFEAAKELRKNFGKNEVASDSPLPNAPLLKGGERAVEKSDENAAPSPVVSCDPVQAAASAAAQTAQAAQETQETSEAQGAQEDKTVQTLHNAGAVSTASAADAVDVLRMAQPGETYKSESFSGVSKPLRVVLSVCAAALLIFAVWFGKDYFTAKAVKITLETMDGIREISADVKAGTVSEALNKLGVSVSDVDAVMPCPSSRLKANMNINVTKRLEASATLAGKKVRFIKIPGTVKENLLFNNIPYDGDDIISPGLSKKLRSNMDVEVKDVQKIKKKKKVTVESGSRVILDPTLSSGVMAETEGVDGVAQYVYTYTYINGKKSATKKKFKKWLTEPQDHLIRLGTASTGQSGDVSILRTFTSNTTAYYCGTKARGAAGSHCHYGTCAVDPKTFPYGSRFWVQGYGYCVANDCGGAIKGTKLDLYMSGSKQCFRWGRRWVTAYLLG